MCMALTQDIFTYNLYCLLIIYYYMSHVAVASSTQEPSRLTMHDWWTHTSTQHTHKVVQRLCRSVFWVWAAVPLRCCGLGPLSRGELHRNTAFSTSCWTLPEQPYWQPYHTHISHQNVFLILLYYLSTQAVTYTVPIFYNKLTDRHNPTFGALSIWMIKSLNWLLLYHTPIFK